MLKVVLDEKKKSIARKRSNLAGPFPARATEVVSAFSGKCPLPSGELWEPRGAFVHRQQRPLQSTVTHTHCSPQKTAGITTGLLRIIKVLLQFNHCVFVPAD